jgi:toxin ParE1/3/4
MKLRIDAEAQAELQEAVLWYESRRTGLGLELLAEVDEGIERIRKTPFQFARLETMPDEQTIRRLLLRRFPFKLIYEVVEDELHVLAIAHTQRRPGYWKHRR